MGARGNQQRRYSCQNKRTLLPSTTQQAQQAQRQHTCVVSVDAEAEGEPVREGGAVVHQNILAPPPRYWPLVWVCEGNPNLPQAE